MKTFEYRGYDRTGRSRRGMIEAMDLKTARESLSMEGILAETVNPAGEASRPLFRRNTVVFPASARIVLYHELGVLLESGITLLNGLGILINSPEMGSARTVLGHVRDRVREGDTLADALTTAWSGLPPFEPALIMVGEKSGMLAITLQKLARFVEEQQRIREKIQTALIYPAIIMTLAIIIAIVMLGFILPYTTRMLAETGRVSIPLLTRAMVAAGRVLLWSCGPVLLLVFLAKGYFRRRTDHDHVFAARVDQIFFRLPVVARAYSLLVNLRFARTLAIMLQGGVAIVDGMELAARATGSPWILLCAAGEREKVRHGSSLADAIRRIPPLAGALPGWIQSGEASGALARLLDTAADSFQYRWEKHVARLLSLLEPVLIAIIGAFVLLVVLAILLPVLAMSHAMG